MAIRCVARTRIQAETFMAATLELPRYAPRDPDKSKEWMAEAESNRNDHALHQLKRLKEYIDSGDKFPNRWFDPYALMFSDEWILVTMPHEMFCQSELRIDGVGPFKHTMNLAMREKGGYEAGCIPNCTAGGANSRFLGPPDVGAENIIKETIQKLWAKR